MKYCATCDTERPIEDFDLNRSAKDGRQGHCKFCVSAYRSRNREKARKATKEWRANNLERARQAVRDYHKNRAVKRPDSRKEWESRNRHRIRERSRECYERNIEANRAKRRAYYASNKETFRERDRNRHAKEVGAVGSHTAGDIEGILAGQLGLCASPACYAPLSDGGPNKFHIDHNTPLSRGGSNDPENLCLLCPRCNWRKGTSSMIVFLAVA